MEILINIGIAVLTFIGMEGVAWLSHKYIMHGLLWRWHKDHHEPKYDQVFEKNDYFFLIFALPGIAGIFGGVFYDIAYLLSFGVGITWYGMAYFFIHDVFIHQRIKIWKQIPLKYFKLLRKAHKLHHKNRGKEGGVNFGMLWVPTNLWKD